MAAVAERAGLAPTAVAYVFARGRSEACRRGALEGGPADDGALASLRRCTAQAESRRSVGAAEAARNALFGRSSYCARHFAAGRVCERVDGLRAAISSSHARSIARRVRVSAVDRSAHPLTATRTRRDRHDPHEQRAAGHGCSQQQFAATEMERSIELPQRNACSLVSVMRHEHDGCPIGVHVQRPVTRSQYATRTPLPQVMTTSVIRPSPLQDALPRPHRTGTGEHAGRSSGMGVTYDVAASSNAPSPIGLRTALLHADEAANKNKNAAPFALAIERIPSRSAPTLGAVMMNSRGAYQSRSSWAMARSILWWATENPPSLLSRVTIGRATRARDPTLDSARESPLRGCVRLARARPFPLDHRETTKRRT